MINWLIDFLSDRKQRIVHNNVVTGWKCFNRGTIQGSVNGPYLFILFLNDLVIDEPQSASLIKYADDSTVIIPVCRGMRDKTEKVLDSFLYWTEINNMKCNTDKYKEVSIIKRGCSRALPLVQGIEQLKEHTVLGLTLQDDCKYSAHVRSKWWEANKCFFITSNSFH